LAATSPGGLDNLWTVAVRSLPPHAEKNWSAEFSEIFTGMAFSPDDRLLAIPLRNGAIQIWSTDRGEQICELTMSSQPPQHLAFTPDGNSLAWIVEGQDGIEELDLAALRQQLAEVGLEW
jgi:WD40 repeat protein